MFLKLLLVSCWVIEVDVESIEQAQRKIEVLVMSAAFIVLAGSN